MKPVGYCRGWYGRTPQSSRRLASSAQGTPFGCPKGEPYIQACKRHKNKVTHLHKQHLKKSTLPIQARATIGVGKPQADSEVRANSAGRFRCGCTRSYTLRVNPSTSFAGPPPLSGEAYLANAVKIKVAHIHEKPLEYQHYRYRQGQLAALASHRRTESATSEFRRTVSMRLH